MDEHRGGAAQSAAMLKIPGPPVISKTMQIINGAPSYEPENFNPAKLVRTVNHLMPMRSEKTGRRKRDRSDIDKMGGI